MSDSATPELAPSVQRSKLLPICVALLATLILAALFAPWLSPYGAEQPDWQHLSLAPDATSAHWFGTDAIGRDVFVRSFVAGRLSLAIGIAASLIALVIGLSYGVVAGYLGGRTDAVLMRLLDVASSLPFLLVVILLLTLFERSLTLLLASIGGYVWLDLARVVRAEAARLREAPFVLAARALGASTPRILLRHIVPNVLGIALVYLSLIVPQAILVESFLSFLGLSVDEPSVSWGALLAEGVQELETAPWTLLFPASLLMLTLAAFNFLGDALRDRFDPRQRG